MRGEPPAPNPLTLPLSPHAGRGNAAAYRIRRLLPTGCGRSLTTMSEMTSYLGWTLDYANPAGAPAFLGPDSVH